LKSLLPQVNWQPPVKLRRGPFLTSVRLKIVATEFDDFKGTDMTEKRTPAKRPSAITGRKTAKVNARNMSSKEAEPVVRAVSDQEIALRAYALWEERGRPFGSPDEDWHNARTQLSGKTNTSESSNLSSSV
jgi:hypothetical protein